MNHIKAYILSVILAAVIAGILINFFPKKGAQAAIIQLLAGIFITVTVISPWKKIHFNDITNFIDSIEASSTTSVGTGNEAYNQAMRSGIMDRTQAYILEKAALLGADVEVTVSLSNDAPPAPVAAKICGNVSPYARKKLSQIIATDLGIPEESQTWN